jgi:hypothetical protein
MIGDVKDYLEFSEMNIDWQYRRELQAIRRIAERAETELEQSYTDHLGTNAEHRFMVSLPLRVRYGAVVALTTSVEWSVRYLVERLQQPLSQPAQSRNGTVHALFELDARAKMGKTEGVRDYEALVHVRNCIAHNAGIEKDYRFRQHLPTAIGRLAGFSLGSWHLFGKHVCIDRGALNPFIDAMGELVVELHKACHEQGLIRPGWPLHLLENEQLAHALPSGVTRRGHPEGHSEDRVQGSRLAALTWGTRAHWHPSKVGDIWRKNL